MTKKDEKVVKKCGRCGASLKTESEKLFGMCDCCSGKDNSLRDGGGY